LGITVRNAITADFSIQPFRIRKASSQEVMFLLVKRAFGLKVAKHLAAKFHWKLRYLVRAPFKPHRAPPDQMTPLPYSEKSFKSSLGGVYSQRPKFHK
jgi:hypothetical protein